MSDEKATRALTAYERVVADHMPGGATYEAMISKGDKDMNTTLYRGLDEAAPINTIVGLDYYGSPAPIPDAAPAMIGVGTWRLYFNRHAAAGLPWCVAPDGGGWELAVAGINVRVPSATVYAPNATPDDEDGRPSAWIACDGRLTITAGVAAIATP